MPASNLEQLSILVIDDEEFMRNLLVQMLYQIGVKSVAVAHNGPDAQLKLEVNRLRPDLIICDILMPDVSGLQFVKMVRGNKLPCDPDVPVLLLTGVGDEEVVVAAAGVGINGYLKKPVALESLRQRIAAAVAQPMSRPLNDEIPVSE